MMKAFPGILLLLSALLTISHADDIDTSSPTLSDAAAEWNDTATIAPYINDTLIPTIYETEVPDESASTVTTGAPTAFTPTPTSSPVLATTDAPTYVVDVMGRVPLKLMDTPSLLIGSTEIDFLNAVGFFLTDKLKTIGGQGSLGISQIGLLRQYREQLRQRDQTGSSPLFVDVRVIARLGGSEASETDAFEFDGVLKMIFETYAEDFLESLKAVSEDVYFDEISDVEVVPLPAAAPTTPPAMSPGGPTLGGDGPSSFDSPSGEDSTQDDDRRASPWSIGVIVGVAAAGAVVLILLLVIVCRLTTNKDSGRGHEPLADQRISASGSSGYGKEGHTYANSGTSSKETPKRRKKWLLKSRGKGEHEEVEDEAVESFALQEQASDLESQGLYSYMKNDSDSVMGGSVMQNNSMMGMDNMSYAYSLEPGIEPSVAGGYAGDQSTFHDGNAAVSMEAPPITVIAPKGKPFGNRTVSASSSAAPGSAFGLEASLNGYIEDTAREMQLSPSDLRLTESELAMLPSNLRDSAEEAEERPRTPPPKTKVITAPSGKLGIVIDTTVEGPVVHHVNDASALNGKIFPGDVIVAIDDVDTRAMSASAITALMVKTANQERRLTVLDKRSKKTNTSSNKSKKSKNSKR